MMDSKIKEILAILPDLYALKDMDQQDVLKLFSDCDAGWLHNGNPENPHVILRSGDCSTGYFNCRLVTRYTNLCEILAYQLVRKLAECGVDKKLVDCVVGSPYSAITISFEVARMLGALHFFTEKDPNDPGRKGMFFKEEIPSGARVLQIEDLITTSGTFTEVRRAVQAKHMGGVNFLPYVATIIHRPSKVIPFYPFGEERIIVIPLAEVIVESSKQSECPLCAEGSERLSAKDNWAKLTQNIKE